MPLTENAKALTEAALEPFGDDRETAYVREDGLEFDANTGESSGDRVVLDGMVCVRMSCRVFFSIVVRKTEEDSREIETSLYNERIPLQSVIFTILTRLVP